LLRCMVAELATMATEPAPMAVEPSMMVEELATMVAELAMMAAELAMVATELATMAAELAMIEGACHSHRQGSWKVSAENSRVQLSTARKRFKELPGWLDRLDRLQDEFLRRVLKDRRPASVAQSLRSSYSTSYYKTNDCCKPQQQLQGLR